MRASWCCRAARSPGANVRVKVDAVTPTTPGRTAVAQAVADQTVTADANGDFSLNFGPQRYAPGTRFEVRLSAQPGQPGRGRAAPGAVPAAGLKAAARVLHCMTGEPAMQLAEIQRIKLWQIEHRRTQPLEYHAWDAVLTVWLMGWVGWLPVFAFDALWLTPLCLGGMAAPGLYASWRARLHRQRQLRCDWLDPRPHWRAVRTLAAAPADGWCGTG